MNLSDVKFLINDSQALIPGNFSFSLTLPPLIWVALFLMSLISSSHILLNVPQEMQILHEGDIQMLHVTSVQFTDYFPHFFSKQVQGHYKIKAKCINIMKAFAKG